MKNKISNTIDPMSRKTRNVISNTRYEPHVPEIVAEPVIACPPHAPPDAAA